ncbi:MAG: potassium channel protein, partial [Acidobacteria bacterium]|nr:potassium channel protein [Acidobacteriota bacterium]
MQRSKRRLFLLVLALPALVVFFGWLYMLGMEHLEKDPRTFLQSLSWSAETLTTTGYGADSSWEHPAMVGLAILVQFAGVFLVFLIIPIYLIPFLEERFESRLPRTAPEMHGHVVVLGFSATVDTLLDRLPKAGLETLVLESREVEARQLFDAGRQVLHLPLEEKSLEAANLLSARVLIANASDEENAGLILAAREMGFENDILCLVEEPFHRRPLMLAGATAVFTPRHMLGAALAARASHRISPRVSGIEQLGVGVSLRELRIQEDSPLAGKTLAGAAVGSRTGATVIGQWLAGDLHPRPSADMELEAGGVLVAVGSDDSLDR